MKLYASVYIGSNEIILKVFKVTAEKRLKELDCLRTPIDVAQDIYVSEELKKETINRLCNVLNDMKKTIAMYQIKDYEVYAGSSFHGAKNRFFVLEQIKLRTGIQVVMLSNSEHRFLSYRAVASLDTFEQMVSESAAIVDIGGAGLQITLFQKGKVKTTQHIMLGTVMMSENMKRLSYMTNYKEQVAQVMYKELETFVTMYMADIKVKYLIILGDYVSTLMEHSSEYRITEPVKLEQYIKFLTDINKDVLSNTVQEIDILNAHEELVEPFLMLHRAIAEMIPAKYVYISGVSVNEGMAYHYLAPKKYLKVTHDFDEDILSAAWSIAKRYGSYQPHLKALDSISVQIFDVMRKYHGLGKRQRLLMRLVAILHDCGKYISISDASICSYTIVMSSEILGLTHKEREMVATVVSLNRKQLEGYDSLADRFTVDEYMTVVKLLAILKVANALDRSHKQKFKNIKMAVRDDKLHITMETKDSIALEKGMFEEKADFFEKVFSVRPILREQRIFE